MSGILADPFILFLLALALAGLLLRRFLHSRMARIVTVICCGGLLLAIVAQAALDAGCTREDALIHIRCAYLPAVAGTWLSVVSFALLVLLRLLLLPAALLGLIYELAARIGKRPPLPPGDPKG